LSRHDNQVARYENIACVTVAARQSSPRRDRQIGLPVRRNASIQIVALHTVFRVIVPNTHVTFDLRPHGGDNWLFEGTLGGRLFAFDARTLMKLGTARK